MIIIFQSDSSTEFLSVILNGISAQLPIEIYYPNFNLNPRENVLDLIKEADSSRVIIYMGHGTSDEINVNNGMDSVISSHDAKTVFKNKKLVFLSCYSSDFLNSLNGQFEAGIGFGNIITSMQELSSAENDTFKHEGYKCIKLFRERLVKLFKDSIIEAHTLNFSFLQFYNSLKLRINKILSQCSLSEDKTEWLVGKLMFDLKKEMKLFGNLNAHVI